MWLSRIGYVVFPKTFLASLYQRAWCCKTERERENNFAEQGWRRCFKSCWPKKCLSRDKGWLLPPNRVSHEVHMCGQPQMRAPSDLGLKWSLLAREVPGETLGLQLLGRNAFTFSLSCKEKPNSSPTPSSRWPEITWNAFISCLLSAASTSICWKLRLTYTKEQFRNHENMNHHGIGIDPPYKFQRRLTRSFHSPGEVQCFKAT